MEEKKRVFLKDGREICLEDDDEILLSILARGEVQSTCLVSYPSGGYGGGGLRLSPSGRYVLFAYFSGESEEAFILFQIVDDVLEVVFESGYLCGEEADYLFHDEETVLYQTLRTGSWHEDEARVDEEGKRFYEFGKINLFDMQKRTFQEHAIFVYPAEDWEEEVTDEGEFRLLGIEDGKLCIRMPWGIVRCELPLRGSVVIRS